MNKTINKITFAPPIKGYLGYAFPLSILFAGNKNFLPWMYSNHNYIMMVSKKDFTSFEQEDSDWMHGREGVFKRDYIMLPKYILDKKDTILELIVSIIENNGYIITVSDEYYIPERRAYMTRHFCHENMAYGFDKTREIFNIAGYTDKGYYGGTEISFDDYITALKQNKFDDFTLNIITPSDAFSPEFSSEKCKTLLGYYLTGNDKEHDLDNVDYYHGIDAVKNLYYYLEHVKSNNINIDIRYFYYLWEHKKFMFDRINYMIGNGYVSGDADKYKQYAEVVKKSQIIKYLVIRYNSTKSETTLKNIQDLIHFIVCKEEEILGRLLKSIEN